MCFRDLYRSFRRWIDRAKNKRANQDLQERRLTRSPVSSVRIPAPAPNTPRGDPRTRREFKTVLDELRIARPNEILLEQLYPNIGRTTVSSSDNKIDAIAFEYENSIMPTQSQVLYEKELSEKVEGLKRDNEELNQLLHEFSSSRQPRAPAEPDPWSQNQPSSSDVTLPTEPLPTAENPDLDEDESQKEEEFQRQLQELNERHARELEEAMNKRKLTSVNK